MADFIQTYAQVRNFAQGSGCKDDNRLDFFMVACLQEVWSKVCDDAFYAEKRTPVLAEGASTLDVSDCSTIRGIRVRYTVDGEEYCRTIAGVPPRGRLCACPTSGGSELCEHLAKGIPSTFEIVDEMLLFDVSAETDMTVEIDCYRNVDCGLYDVDDEGVRVWKTVDLPPEYHSAYANLVLSKAFAEDGNFNAATYWAQISSTGLDSLIEKPRSKYNPQAGGTSTKEMEPKVIYRGETRDCYKCGSSCGCDVEVEQILVEKVYVDCDGVPIDPQASIVPPDGRKDRVVDPRNRTGRFV